MDPEPITQHALAVSLGISAGELKKIRAARLIEKEHWTGGSGGQPVCFTPAGVRMVRAILGLPEQSDGAAVGTMPAPSPAKKTAGATRVALTVVRPARNNPRVVLCKTAAGLDATLQVKSNVNFTPGMVLPTCVARPSSPAVFDYEGRLPRRKGHL